MCIRDSANGLQTAVDRRTKAYVSDVTFQMAQNIDAQLANVMQTLEMLTDSPLSFVITSHEIITAVLSRIP